MQKYIRIILSFILILSNLSVAFSMHLCQGEIEEIKFSHQDKKVCKINEKPTCCAKNEQNKCDTSHAQHKEKDDCCKDLAYLDDLQDQHSAEVFRISPIVFDVYKIDLAIDTTFIEVKSVKKRSILDSYIESNAPPIYILNSQLVLYEA